LALAAGLVWGQGRASVPTAPSATASAAKRASPDDAELEAAIRRRFERSKIAVNGFRVRVHSGVAVIEGKTGIPQHKGTATRLARAAGARRVDNRIEVSEQARQKAAQQLRSAPRRVHVRRSEDR
jgi:hypothetical protein